MTSRQLKCGTNKLRMPIQIKISPAEASYRSSHYSDISSISTIRLSCTRCNSVLKARMVTDKNVHPILEVLLCVKCRHFYDQRQLQSQNSYCKWCANDRKLFRCSTCSAGFCEECINKHFRLARTVFQEVSERKWKCCICFSKPIWSQRAICAVAERFSNESNNALKERIAKCKKVKKSVGSQWHIEVTQSSITITRNPSPQSRSSTSVTVPVTASSHTLTTSTSLSDGTNQRVPGSQLQDMELIDTELTGNPSPLSRSSTSVTVPVTASSHTLTTSTSLSDGTNQRVPGSQLQDMELIDTELTVIEDAYVLCNEQVRILPEKKLCKQSENNSKECVICLQNSCVMVLYPCGHKCLCKECSVELSRYENICPLCRSTFKDIIQIYE